MIDGRNSFDQLVKNNLRTCNNNSKILQLVKEIITQLAVY